MNVNWLFGKCRRFEQALSLMAANRLPPQEREGLQAHLERCPKCQAELARLQALSRGLEQWRDSEPKIASTPHAHFRLRAALRAAEQQQVGSKSAEIVGWLSGKRLLWASIAAAWAAILALNLDSSEVVVMADRSQPVSPKSVLMVLRSKDKGPSYEMLERSAEPLGLPPQSRLRIRRDAQANC